MVVVDARGREVSKASARRACRPRRWANGIKSYATSRARTYSHRQHALSALRQTVFKGTGALKHEATRCMLCQLPEHAATLIIGCSNSSLHQSHADDADDGAADDVAMPSNSKVNGKQPHLPLHGLGNPTTCCLSIYQQQCHRTRQQSSSKTAYADEQGLGSQREEAFVTHI